MFFVCHEKTQNHSGWLSRGTAKNTCHFLWHKYVEMLRNLQPDYSNGQLGDNQAVVGDVANKNKTKDVKVGFASGKLGDKTYVVMVMF